jgi:hypothetical protein
MSESTHEIHLIFPKGPDSPKLLDQLKSPVTDRYGNVHSPKGICIITDITTTWGEDFESITAIIIESEVAQ